MHEDPGAVLDRRSLFSHGLLEGSRGSYPSNTISLHCFVSPASKLDRLRFLSFVPREVERGRTSHLTLLFAEIDPRNYTLFTRFIISQLGSDSRFSTNAEVKFHPFAQLVCRRSAISWNEIEERKHPGGGIKKSNNALSFGESKINDPLRQVFQGVENSPLRPGRGFVGVSRQPIFRGHVEKENSITWSNRLLVTEMTCHSGQRLTCQRA